MTSPAAVELRQKALEHIKSHPSEWDQNHWNSCFAGNAVKIAVAEGSLKKEDVTQCHCGCGQINSEVLARQLLELDTWQASCLFAGSNGLAQIERYLAEFAEEPALT